LKWIEWSQKLQAIAQNGLTYSKDKFDIERFKQIQEIAAEIISDHTNHNFPKVHHYLTSEEGYATPKIDIRGAVFNDDKILMVKEVSDGLWTLPGGWADIHETPGENIEREVLEESGYKVSAKKLLAVYDRSRHGHIPLDPQYVYKMFFLCEIVSGSPRKSLETSDAGFFGLDELPDLSIARVTEKQIHRMFELKDIKETDFD